MDDPSGMKRPAVAVDERINGDDRFGRPPIREPDDVPIIGLGNG